jgi:hypothetical protein
MMIRLAFGVWLTLMFTVFGCASNELRQAGNSYPNSPGDAYSGSGVMPPLAISGSSAMHGMGG